MRQHQAKDMKWCPTCNAFVLYEESEILNHDTCVTCGDIVVHASNKETHYERNQEIMDQMVYEWNETEEQDDDATDLEVTTEDIEEIHITPALTLYHQNRNTSLWFITELLDEFHHVWKTSPDLETRRQAWQYVKAMIYILKERNAWEPSWEDCRPGTPEWMEWWKHHKEDQNAMAEHARMINKLKLELLYREDWAYGGLF